jgi:hypothetical protein
MVLARQDLVDGARKLVVVYGLTKAWSVLQSTLGKPLAPVGGRQHEGYALFLQRLRYWRRSLALKVHVKHRDTCSPVPHCAERPFDGRSGVEHKTAQPPEQTLQFHGDDQFVLDDEDPEAVQTSECVRYIFPSVERGRRSSGKRKHRFEPDAFRFEGQIRRPSQLESKRSPDEFGSEARFSRCGYGRTASLLP